MTAKQGLAFVERHGIVRQAARGPAPSLAEAVAGEPIRGSWWGHPKGREIFRVAEAVSESPRQAALLSTIEAARLLSPFA